MIKLGLLNSTWNKALTTVTYTVRGLRRVER
jgi:hypothetical protein